MGILHVKIGEPIVLWTLEDDGGECRSWFLVLADNFLAVVPDCNGKKETSIAAHDYVH
jgi:hypothetical protein